MISIYVLHTSSHMLINALVFSNVKRGKKSEWSHFQCMNGHSQVSILTFQRQVWLVLSITVLEILEISMTPPLSRPPPPPPDNPVGGWEVGLAEVAQSRSCVRSSSLEIHRAKMELSALLYWSAWACSVARGMSWKIRLKYSVCRKWLLLSLPLQKTKQTKNENKLEVRKKWFQEHYWKGLTVSAGRRARCVPLDLHATLGLWHHLMILGRIWPCA